MEPAVAGALVGGGLTAAGAGIGAALAAWITARNQRQTAEVNIAVEAAKAERETLMRVAKGSGRTAMISPLSLGAFYHLEVLKLLRRNKLSPETLSELHAKVLALDQEVDNFSSDKRKDMQPTSSVTDHGR